MEVSGSGRWTIGWGKWCFLKLDPIFEVQVNVGCLSFLEGCFKYIDRPIFVSFYKLQYDISTSFSLKTVVIIRMLLQKLLHKWKQPATSPKLNL